MSWKHGNTLSQESKLKLKNWMMGNKVSDGMLRLSYLMIEYCGQVGSWSLWFSRYYSYGLE
ncbi:hypothetical protein O9929_23415 [Vibrio lentus]|nr:hypothetical protein [Vibrio lentus]